MTDIVAIGAIVVLIVAFVASAVGRVEQESIKKRGRRRSALDSMMMGGRVSTPIREQFVAVCAIGILGLIIFVFLVLSAN